MGLGALPQMTLVMPKEALFCQRSCVYAGSFAGTAALASGMWLFHAPDCYSYVNKTLVKAPDGPTCVWRPIAHCSNRVTLLFGH